jgi:hypothetical protein
MGLKSETDLLVHDRESHAFRAAFTPAAAQTIFTIVGGPVHITGLGCYCNTALDVGAAGSTFQFAINGVNMSNAFAVTGTAIGDIIACPFQAVNMVTAAVVPVPTALGFAGTGGFGVVAGPALGAVTGLIVCTVGVAALAVGETCSFYCIYRALAPNSQIV